MYRFHSYNHFYSFTLNESNPALNYFCRIKYFQPVSYLMVQMGLFGKFHNPQEDLILSSSVTKLEANLAVNSLFIVALCIIAR